MSEELKAKMVDETGKPAIEWKAMPPVLIRKAEIDAEIERLSKLPAPENGRRQTSIVHPYHGMSGLAPGIKVKICVLNPGERTAPVRENATQVNFCIQGGGSIVINGKPRAYTKYDTFNIPSWHVYEHVNDTDEVQVRLCYSNAALLEKMRVHIVDENPPAPGEEAAAAAKAESGEKHEAQKHPFGTFQITDEGAYLMPYETLVNPDVVESKALHWPWKLVKENLDKLASLGQEYRGRRLYLMYNPSTGRTNGITNNFFATITIRPPKISDRPHRHVSAAINYFFSGSGHSIVENKRYEWSAGDLMLTAPGWARHCHNSHDEAVYELTIQDSPLNIAMESLLWQEDLGKPASVLGAMHGFDTNREAVSK